MVDHCRLAGGKATAVSAFRSPTEHAMWSSSILLSFGIASEPHDESASAQSKCTVIRSRGRPARARSKPDMTVSYSSKAEKTRRGSLNPAQHFRFYG